MNSVLEFLKDKVVIAAAAVILILLIIFFLTSIFQISFLLKAGILVFVVFLFVVLFLFKRIKELKRAGQIEQSINVYDQANLSPEKKSEIDQFKKQLENAIESLKKSRIGKGKSGKAALYALPWYMIIGPSAAGKTTAIQNSGLDFPFGKEGFRGVGGTRNCDWFFSTQGIFLDTAGRYVTQSEDNIEWLSFLEVLKKNRRKKPVNGVIAALNIDEIINSDKEQLHEHAENIRLRIDELIENLNINFPVYFIFTKCDLIKGFIEYFGDFSEIERSQIWGTTFSVSQFNFNPKDIFLAEFRKLTSRLFESRKIRLSSPLKREQKKKVFLFPFQFKSLEEKLAYLIGEVFQANPYKDNPIFRGFYFTSGTQEGLPLDLAVKEIAKQYNLPQINGEDSDEIIEKKNYFIKDLLNDIIIGDQNFSVSQTAGFLKKQNKLKLAVILSSCTALVLFLIFTFIGYNTSSAALKNLSEASFSFSKINWRTGNILNNFTKAEKMRALLHRTENGKLSEGFISFGMDRGETVYPSAKALFLKKTGIFFNNNILKEVIKTLNDYANGQDFSGEEVYNYLKAYLLLGIERARLDTNEQKFLSNVFMDILMPQYINSNLLASVTEKDSLKFLFKNNISFFVANLNENNFFKINNDNLLVNIIRSRLQFKPNAESIYARLKSKGLNEFSNDISLEQSIGGRYTSLINTNQKIPYIFTNNGWRNYIKPSIIRESINPGQEDWVLGKRNAHPSSDFNSEKMKRDLLVLYVNDFKKTWMQFFQSIRFLNFDNVPLASSNLKLLSDPVNSPVILILKAFADQARLIFSSQDSLTSGNFVFASIDTNNTSIVEINKYENFILGSKNNSSPGDLNAVIAQYGIISSVLESIKDGRDLVKDYAVKVLSQSAVELPTSIMVIKGAAYNIQDIQDFLTAPVKLTWKAIISDASQYLNDQWKVKIVDVFNRSMTNSYPFNNSQSDVPLQDFSDFFNPDGGIFWSFYNNELSAFINKGNWKINRWDNIGLNVSNRFLFALKKADDISNIFFKDGDLGLSFRLRPVLPVSKEINGNKPVIEQVYLFLDGIENYYRMGSPFWTDYVWPGNKGTPGARINISIRDYGSSDTKIFNGDWALFRLLEDGAVTRGGSSSQFIFNSFFQKQNYYDVVVSYELNAESSRNPFSASFFKSFNLPSKIN